MRAGSHRRGSWRARAGSRPGWSTPRRPCAPPGPTCGSATAAAALEKEKPLLPAASQTNRARPRAVVFRAVVVPELPSTAKGGGRRGGVPGESMASLAKLLAFGAVGEESCGSFVSLA
jgi:hypothetical protein